MIDTITVLLGDIPIKINYNHKRLASSMADYICDRDAEIEITLTDDDIQRERDMADGEFSAGYLETLAAARQIFCHLAQRGCILFHSCSVEYNGKAYLFAAVSGTGKSTHASLWLDLLGDKAKILNGDKPLLKIDDGIPHIYGTPFMGKEGWGYNGKAPIAAICFLCRSKENYIHPITSGDAFVRAYVQTFKPDDSTDMTCVVDTLTKIINTVPLYELGCNISLDAARVAFETMTGEKIN